MGRAASGDAGASPRRRGGNLLSPSFVPQGILPPHFALRLVSAWAPQEEDRSHAASSIADSTARGCHLLLRRFLAMGHQSTEPTRRPERPEPPGTSRFPATP